MEKSIESIIVKVNIPSTKIQPTITKKISMPHPIRPMPNYDVYNSDGVVIGRDC